MRVTRGSSRILKSAPDRLVLALERGLLLGGAVPPSCGT